MQLESVHLNCQLFSMTFEKSGIVMKLVENWSQVHLIGSYWSLKSPLKLIGFLFFSSKITVLLTAHQPLTSMLIYKWYLYNKCQTDLLNINLKPKFEPAMVLCTFRISLHFWPGFNMRSYAADYCNCKEQQNKWWRKITSRNIFYKHICWSYFVFP